MKDREAAAGARIAATTTAAAATIAVVAASDTAVEDIVDTGATLGAVGPVGTAGTAGTAVAHPRISRWICTSGRQASRLDRAELG